MENSKKRYTMMENLDYKKSQCAKTPTKVQRMWRVPYASAVDMVLMYGAKPEDELKVSCYADASFQTDKDDTKSQTGYVFVLNGIAVVWKSTKKSTTAMSSTEAEYIAAAEASMEAVWMRKFIDGLGGVMPSNKRPMEMLCDNEPALAIASDPIILKGAKHIKRKYQYIREVIQEGEIVLKKVHTDDNVANPFTKPMPLNKHFEHAMAIGIIPATSLMHRDLARNYTPRKSVAPVRNRILVYPDSDKEDEEYCSLPPLLPCFQTPQPCATFNPVHHNSHSEVGIDNMTLEEYTRYE
ncbi:hypothetical protein Tco_0432848 [Tanacetum coccineum]